MLSITSLQGLLKETISNLRGLTVKENCYQMFKHFYVGLPSIPYLISLLLNLLFMLIDNNIWTYVVLIPCSNSQINITLLNLGLSLRHMFQKFSIDLSSIGDCDPLFTA